MKNYHKIHPLKIAPHVRFRRETQVVIVLAALMIAVVLAALMQVLAERDRLQVRLEESLIAQWERDAKVYVAYEQGCLPQLLLPVEMRRK